MNKHINPPESVKEIGTIPAGTIGARERFILLAGKRDPWVYGDLSTRAEAIQDLAENFTSVVQIIAFSLEAGTCRDATNEIASIVIERWAQDDVELTNKQRDWVASIKGEAFANAFRTEVA